MATAKIAPQKSTTVRSNGRRSLQRLTLHVLEALIPSIVERWAALQFLTPRRIRPEDLALPLDEAFDLRSGTYHLRAWSWGVGPVVLLVHGWEGHAGQLRGFVEPLVNQGFRVVAVDLPAHGFSSGRRTTVLDFADALCAVEDVVGPVHAVIAHSFGGAATALALHPGRRTDQRLLAQRVVLLAPPEGPAHFVQGVTGLLGLSPKRSEGIARHVQALVGIDFAAVTIPRFAHQLRVPLLLMHDPADRVVPWAHAQAIATAWPGARLLPTPRLGHHRILTDPQVIAEAVSFIADPSVAR
ncbi:MAG TPA: alpha/beta fold hydrolase [Symbiobacteriaceae bacterium]|nr:alpha/beta fold hydrolase [Symbiobacteriaceae bacterium]